MIFLFDLNGDWSDSGKNRRPPRRRWRAIRRMRRARLQCRTWQTGCVRPPELNEKIVAKRRQGQRCNRCTETRRDIVDVFIRRFGGAVLIQPDDLQTAARTDDNPVAENAGLKLMRLLCDEDAGQARQKNRNGGQQNDEARNNRQPTGLPEDSRTLPLCLLPRCHPTPCFPVSIGTGTVMSKRGPPPRVRRGDAQRAGSTARHRQARRLTSQCGDDEHDGSRRNEEGRWRLPPLRSSVRDGAQFTAFSRLRAMMTCWTWLVPS